jgi:hypothetical protein
MFQNLPVIDSDIKIACSTIVTCHLEALAMKEKLDLLIAMQELADNKIQGS